MVASTSPVQVVLLDIEGTVCPISFVKDVLFPYALKVLPKTVETQWDNPGFKEYRDLFPPEYRDNQDAFQAHVIDLVTRDQKVSYLKSLQGYLWAEGYASGEIKAPLFPDVAAVLSRWHGKGLKLMIYSSGSVPAQQLLFKHTNANPADMTWLISDWFDTINAGLKTETASYKAIAKKHPEFPSGRFLFLSDNVKEVEAAIEAGMQSYVVQRPGNADLPAEVYERHQVLETFESIEDDFNVEKPQTLGKRSADEAGSETNTAAEEIEAEGGTTPVEDQEGHGNKRLKAGKDQDTSTATDTSPAVDKGEQEPSNLEKLVAQAAETVPHTKVME